MPTDRRVPSESFPFDHLTIGQIDECERLRKLAIREPLSAQLTARLRYVERKRHPPIYEAPQKLA